MCYPLKMEKTLYWLNIYGKPLQNKKIAEDIL